MGPMMNKLAALLGGNPQLPQMSASQAPLGTGMAAQAAAILRSRPYQLHVQEMQAQGLQPLSPEEFMRQMAR